MAEMFACFQSAGTWPVSYDCWNTFARKGEISAWVSFGILDGSSSGPLAFDGLSCFSCFSIPVLVISSGLILFVLLCPRSGMLFRSSVVNTLLYWLFRISAFHLLSITCSLFSFWSGDIPIESFFLDLMYFQNFFPSVGWLLPSFSSFSIWRMYSSCASFMVFLTRSRSCLYIFQFFCVLCFFAALYLRYFCLMSLLMRVLIHGTCCFPPMVFCGMFSLIQVASVILVLKYVQFSSVVYSDMWSQALVSFKKYMAPPLPYIKVNIYPFPLPHFASIFFAYLWSFRWPNYIVTLPRYFSFRLPHLNIHTRPPSDKWKRIVKLLLLWYWKIYLFFSK